MSRFILLYVDECWLLCSCQYLPPPPSVWPHLFCGAGREKRRVEQLKWSLAFTLYIESFPCAQLPGPVHRAECVFLYIFSLGLCFVCLFVLFHLFVFYLFFYLFVSPFFFVSLGNWVISLTVTVQLLNGRCTSLLRAPVSEMIYTVSSGTFNSSIPYHQIKSYCRSAASAKY